MADANDVRHGRGLSNEQRLVIVLVLNLAMLAALVVVGFAAHSLSVLGEGVDYLADAAGVAAALWATWRMRSGDGSRADRLAALLNAGWLLALNLAIVAGAVIRLARGTGHVHGFPVLVVSAVAATVMTAGALILGGDDETEDGGALSFRAVVLDTIADAATAGGVAIVGAVIAVADGLYWLDPAVAMAIALIVGYHAVALVRRAAWPRA